MKYHLQLFGECEEHHDIKKIQGAIYHLHAFFPYSSKHLLRLSLELFFWGLNTFSVGIWSTGVYFTIIPLFYPGGAPFTLQ